MKYKIAQIWDEISKVEETIINYINLQIFKYSNDYVGIVRLVNTYFYFPLR